MFNLNLMHMRMDGESYECAVEYSCHSTHTQNYRTRALFITPSPSKGYITLYQPDRAAV